MSTIRTSHGWQKFDKKTLVSEVPQSNRKEKTKPNGKAELPFITNPVDMTMCNCQALEQN